MDEFAKNKTMNRHSTMWIDPIFKNCRACAYKTGVLEAGPFYKIELMISAQRTAWDQTIGFSLV